jgi:hypothetical protein
MANDVAVRAAKKLAALIQAAKPKAKVFHYWVLGQGPIGESWPDIQSPLEDEWEDLNEKYVPWAHAYIIGYDANNRTKVSNASFADMENLRLWGFYGYLKGTPEKNSADIARTHWADVQDAISAATKLQTVGNPNGVPEIEKHLEWQIDQMGVYWMGDKEKCHIAQGELSLQIKQVINPISIT